MPQNNNQNISYPRRSSPSSSYHVVDSLNKLSPFYSVITFPSCNWPLEITDSLLLSEVMVMVMVIVAISLAFHYFCFAFDLILHLENILKCKL